MAWIRLFYTDISSCVQKNGWTSDFFSLSRAVRQGCPSIQKIPSEMILGYKESKSLTLKVKYPNALMITLSSVFFFHGSQSSFSRCLFLLDTFALISGLKVNYEKTEALWIGPCKCSEITLPSSKPILWAKDKVYALGVWSSTLEDITAHVSFSEKIVNSKRF